MIAGAVASVVALSGCATSANTYGTSGSSASTSSGLTAAELDKREQDLIAREEALRSQGGYSAGSAGSVGVDGDLLPPAAAPGECYARVWVDAEYRTTTEEVIASEASTRIEVVPAQYETVTERVLVSAASSRLETTPAVYGTETETIKVRDGQRRWLVALEGNSAPASEALLASAAAHGINIDAATPGMCFHEHYTPATYRTESEQVLQKAATESVTVVPAQYETVEKQVLVSEASTRLETVPAVYETQTEQVLDKAAHTVWKKGTGPIQRIDESTGEIMCLVEVPATYKTISKEVLVSPATTRTVEIPAVYKTVSVRQEVSAASESRTPIPAVYGTVERTVLDQEAGFVWHPVENTDHPASTRTGNQICLTETPPEYRTVERTVVTTPAQSRSIEIPAEYANVEVTKLVSAASENVEQIPATYRTIEKRELVKDGYMSWRSILCDTNMTTSRIADIQRALVTAGYDIGSGGADGVIGSSTMTAVNAFQRDNDLPVDKYLNIETVKALGVSVK